VAAGISLGRGSGALLVFCSSTAALGRGGLQGEGMAARGQGAAVQQGKGQRGGRQARVQGGAQRVERSKGMAMQGEGCGGAGCSSRGARA
jgi:hypothetical protein